jgi:hypothetical protein
VRARVYEQGKKQQQASSSHKQAAGKYEEPAINWVEMRSRKNGQKYMDPSA